MATVKLVSGESKREYSATTSATGEFAFTAVAAGDYILTVSSAGKIWTVADPMVIKDGGARTSGLQLTQQGQEFRVVFTQDATLPQASGGEHLSTGEVSSLPLNERDFSKLLLLAAGTMTDTNGAANFTQQFAVNGQRGSAGVFAMDGADTTDPELGGATFSNFNVDAIQEVQSSSGVMPADTGHGAAGFTNVITKSGSNQVHGSLFEFVRNAAFDARNFFDHKNDWTRGAFRLSRAMNSESPTALRSSFRIFTMAAARHFISRNIRDSGKFWGQRRYSPCRLRRRGRESTRQLFAAIP